MRKMTLFSLGFLFIACKPPPEAPDDLEQLSEFMFSHMDDEDPAELQAGLVNLDTWLNTGENLKNTTGGYQINNLKDESVADLDDKARTIQETLIGSAVAHSYDHSIDEIIQTLFVDDWSQVTNGMYPCYERIFDDGQDPKCLKNGDCDWASYQTVSVSDWAIVIVVSENSGQIRTVETDYGTAILQRTWLNEPADTSGLLGNHVDLNAQYYINIIAPTADGSILRTAATWFDGQFFIEDEDFFKN